MSEEVQAAKAEEPTATFVSWTARIYRESVNRIDAYSVRVKSGKDLQAALDFGGYILWSGITGICSELARESPKIDGSHLRWKAEELQRDVREWWMTNKKASVDETQLEAINRKLDVIAGQIQRYSISR